MTTKKHSEKKSKAVEPDKDIDNGGDVSFMVMMLQEPTGRKVIVFTSILFLFLPILLLGKEFALVMLAALILTSLITYGVLRFVAKIDINSYIKVLIYGTPTTKKDE